MPDNSAGAYEKEVLKSVSKAGDKMSTLYLKIRPTVDQLDELNDASKLTPDQRKEQADLEKKITAALAGWSIPLDYASSEIEKMPAPPTIEPQHAKKIESLIQKTLDKQKKKMGIPDWLDIDFGDCRLKIKSGKTDVRLGFKAKF